VVGGSGNECPRPGQFGFTRRRASDQRCNSRKAVAFESGLQATLLSCPQVARAAVAFVNRRIAVIVLTATSTDGQGSMFWLAPISAGRTSRAGRMVCSRDGLPAQVMGAALSSRLGERPLGMSKRIIARETFPRWAAGVPVRVELIRCAGQVQLRVLSGSAQADVADLPVQGAVAEQERSVSGEALCLVHGEGVAVFNGATAQVVRRDEGSTLTDAEGQGAGPCSTWFLRRC
jgi:hypothetical protein